MVFEKFNVQAGSDPGGVATDLMSLNSTVRITYKNPATFFGVHVSSTPFQLHYFQLQIASGQVPISNSFLINYSLIYLFIC